MLVKISYAITLTFSLSHRLKSVTLVFYSRGEHQMILPVRRDNLVVKGLNCAASDINSSSKTKDYPPGVVLLWPFFQSIQQVSFLLDKSGP